MDFDLGADADAVRKEAREFLAENVSSDIHERMAETGTYYDADFARALGARGWIASGWPVEEGGGGRNWLEQVALNQELRHADAPMDAIGTTMLIAATLRMFGTPEQKEIMKPAVRGEVVIALGYSEPDSGSDAAAARTRAVRDGDEWVIDGEKMFTTLAQVADYVFVLTRTNPDAKKHRGLTTFLVPTTSAGFSISEVKTLGGERTNITTYEGVRIPDALRSGRGRPGLVGGLGRPRAGAFRQLRRRDARGAGGGCRAGLPARRRRLPVDRRPRRPDPAGPGGRRGRDVRSPGHARRLDAPGGPAAPGRGLDGQGLFLGGVLPGDQRDPRYLRPGVSRTGPRAGRRDPGQDRARLPAQPGDPDLCRYQRDPPEYHRRGRVGPPRTRAGG